MKKVYTRLTELLGQPPDGVLFDHFIAEFGGELQLDHSAYTLSTLGVTLVVTDLLFGVLLIHIDDLLTRQGVICPYGGDLPNAINQADGPETIEQKLSARPVNPEHLLSIGLSRRESQNCYLLPPFVLSFDFAADTEKLSSVSIVLSTEPLLSGDFQLKNKPPRGS
jgi:hypothetical protein